MTLGDAQREFTLDIAYLVEYAYSELGYELTYGDAYRSPSAHGGQGEAGKAGYGKAWSAHKYRLAVDFNLFIDGVYQETTEAFSKMGKFWEDMREENVWGGNFDDGNHFSRRWEGVA